VENADTEIARDGRVHGVAALVLHDLRTRPGQRPSPDHMRRGLGEEEVVEEDESPRGGKK
jgi:hypothetical protein